MISKEQLELVVNKKKISELETWFKEHFVKSSRAEYLNRSPVLIIEGPTGCGKTSCLETIANELKIQIREYSETTDVTAIETELSHTFQHKEETTNLTHSIDRRKAAKFEQFVINNVMFNPLYPTNHSQSHLPSADSEFEDDDDDFFQTISRPTAPPSNLGIIIHIQTPLSFAKSHRIYLQSVSRLVTTIRNLLKMSQRRAAIVFEDSGNKIEASSYTLPVKFRNSLGIKTIKFNPITRTNMKKFIEWILNRNPNLFIDKETTDCIISDCEGDMSACLNSIELLRDVSRNFNSVYMGVEDRNKLPPLYPAANKKQRLNHDVSRIQANQILMRDMSKSVSFFHSLGKIFYQKRLYPEMPTMRRPPKPLERPYPTENDSDFLAQRLGLNPKDLTAWLHEHYHTYCHHDNIERAATMMENLSDVDTISISALQSSQYYEKHHNLDHLQLLLNIEASNFSLYKDQSLITKSSHKRTVTNNGAFILKSSVESSGTNRDGDFYSFNRPVSLTFYKLTQAKQTLLDYLTGEIIHFDPTCRDQTKVLIDYVPYLSHIMLNFPLNHPSWFRAGGINHPAVTILGNQSLIGAVKALGCPSGVDPGQRSVDYDCEHEKLLELIGELEETLGTGGTRKDKAEDN